MGIVVWDWTEWKVRRTGGNPLMWREGPAEKPPASRRETRAFGSQTSWEVGMHSWFQRMGLTRESAWDLSHLSCLNRAGVGMWPRNGDTGKGVYVPRTQSDRQTRMIEVSKHR